MALGDFGNDAYAMFDFLRRRRGLPTPEQVEDFEVGEPEVEEISPLPPMPGRPDRDRLRSHLLTMPERGSYQPRTWERIAGALMEMADEERPGQGINFINRRYNQAMDDWRSRGTGLEDLAKLEGSDLDEQLAYMRAGMERQYKNADLLLKGKGQKSRNKYYESQAATASRQAGVAEQNAETNRKRLGVTERHQRAMEGIAGRGAAAAEGRAKTYAERLAFDKTRPLKGTNKPITPAAQKTAEDLAVSQILDENPDLLDPAFFGDKGKLQGPPKVGWLKNTFGKAQGEYDNEWKQFWKLVDERKKKILGMTTGNLNLPSPVVDDDGQDWVMDESGEWGWRSREEDD